MIKSVTVINHLGESLKMELKRPDTSGFYIISIDGLGPTKAAINITEKATMDGASYNSARVNSRNIVMHLGFMFANDAEEVRHKSYKYFPLKKRITIRIETDTRICETYGYVESNEPDIFSNGETTQISIICPDSYFYDASYNSKNIATFVGTDPNFEFPFSNESLSDSLIVFGEIRDDVEKPVFYSGDVDVGANIYIRSTGDVSNITIYNLSAGERMVIKTERLKALFGTQTEIIDKDEIIISTFVGRKSITLRRNGMSYNIINCLDKNSDWFQLMRGDNVFSYEADKGMEFLQFRVEYINAYEGV